MWYCNQYIHHQISSMFLTWAHLCGSLHRGGQAPGIQFRVPGYIGTLKWRRAKCYWSFSTIHKHDPDVGWRITTTYVTPHFLSQCFLRSREHHIYYDEWAHPSPYLPFQWREASVRTAFWLSKGAAKCPVLFDITLPWKLIVRRIVWMRVLLQSGIDNADIAAQPSHCIMDKL